MRPQVPAPQRGPGLRLLRGRRGRGEERGAARGANAEGGAAVEGTDPGGDGIGWNHGTGTEGWQGWRVPQVEKTKVKINLQEYQGP